MHQCRTLGDPLSQYAPHTSPLPPKANYSPQPSVLEITPTCRAKWGEPGTTPHHINWPPGHNGPILGRTIESRVQYATWQAALAPPDPRVKGVSTSSLYSPQYTRAGAAAPSATSSTTLPPPPMPNTITRVTPPSSNAPLPLSTLHHPPY